MSSRYDSRTTTFSPEGRLYQVEYAAEAISQAGSAVGIWTRHGIVLATEKRSGHALLDKEVNNTAGHLTNLNGEKVFKIDAHVGTAVAGVTADSSILVDYVRGTAHRHRYRFSQAMPVEDLTRTLCDIKQGYTQYGGQRPFGVSFLLAGWDQYAGFQLYHTDPSGNYTGWKAYAIGDGDASANALLRQQWKKNLTLEEAKLLAVNVLQRTLDVSQLGIERVEMAVLYSKTSTPTGTAAAETDDNEDTPKPRDNGDDDGFLIDSEILHPGARAANGAAPNIQFAILSDDELKPVLDKAEALRKKEEAEKAAKEAEREKRLS